MTTTDQPKTEVSAGNAGRFPCLNKNNSIETQKKPNFNEMTTAHKKSEYALKLNTEAFVSTFGLNNVGFLTLTFSDDVQDPQEAQRRFNSLRTNFLKRHFKHYIRVIERTKKGRIHYHLVVATPHDIRRNRKRNPFIREYWKLLRENLPKYQFGRSELLPIKKNKKATARYLSKYIGKHIGNRLPEDKAIRLVQTSQDKKMSWKTVQNCTFQFVSKGSQSWREKLSRFIDFVNANEIIKNPEHQPITHHNYTERMTELTQDSKWIYAHRNVILTVF